MRGQKRRDTWTEQWSAAIGVLGLAPGPSVSVKTVQDYLKRIAEMQQHVTDMRIKAAHVREIAEQRPLLLQRFTALRQPPDSATRPSTADTLDETFAKWIPRAGGPHCPYSTRGSCQATQNVSDRTASVSVFDATP